MIRAVDLFAGWGGFTLGAERAGVNVVWAANHWPLAVEAHAANHPRTTHSCQDLRQADWRDIPAYDLLLASPACQGHSQASQPRRRGYHDAMRATAWAVIDCADVTRPRAVLVENVLDFRRWALYPTWRQALETLGYRTVELVVTASRHGVPQRRTRLFVAAVRSERAARVLFALDDSANRRAIEPAFGGCIEWSSGSWRPIASATPNAQRRIAAAKRAHGPRCLSQHVTSHPGVGLDEPIRTITTKDQWIVVDGDRYRALTVRETARGMGFPDSYQWPANSGRREQIQGLGNAVPPPMAHASVALLAEVA